MKLFTIIILLLNINSYGLVNFSNSKVNSMKSKYGQRVYKRLKLWDNTLQKAKKVKTLKKLKYINDFFNKIRYKTDLRHWKVRDYWASPSEFVGTVAGDCEDYAIAKYFALIKAGVSTNKLRIAYVKLIRKRTKYDQAHMILLYYHQANSVPIVLDNVNKRLTLASKRRDLKFVYSFNALGLWRAKNKGKSGKRVGSSSKLRKWTSLLNKI